MVLSRSRATLSRRDGTSGFPFPFSRGKSRQGKPCPWSLRLASGKARCPMHGIEEGQAMVTLPVSGKQVNGLDGARCEATTKCVAHYPLTINLSKWSLSVVRLSVVDLTIEPSKPTRVPSAPFSPLGEKYGAGSCRRILGACPPHTSHTSPPSIPLGKYQGIPEKTR